MKKIILMALALTALGAKAQFFQHIYGTTSDDVLTNGVNVQFNPQGHFIAGENQSPCLPGIYAIPAAYTDVNGNVPGVPYFERDYFLLTGAGIYLIPEDAQVFELDNGAGFGIVGKYTDPTIASPNTGVYYLLLNPNGFPVASYFYPPNAIGAQTFDVYDVGGIAESVAANGNLLYITGSTVDNTTVYRPFAMKINVNTGAVLWSWIYNINQSTIGDAWGRDIAENWVGTGGPPFAEFVGEVRNTSQGPVNSDGFLQHVDMNNGIPTHPCIFYGTPASEDHWNSINRAMGPGPGPFPPGFVLGGGTDVQGSMDYWVLRMDPIIAHFWSKSFDYSAIGLQTDDCFDVIERLNTANQLEYYATGYTDNGSIGAFDAVDVKMSTFGVAVAGGEFTYGSAGGNEYGESLDQFNGTAADGLSTFGVWDGGGLGGNRDMYLVKSYFNGLSGCNENFATPTDVNEIGPGLHMPSSTLTNFSAGQLLNSFVPINDVQLCYNVTIIGGNNARMANPNSGDAQGKRPTLDAISLQPNPSENGNTKVSLKINSEIAGNANVAIYDMLGKVQYQGKFTLVKGSNVLPLDLSKSTLSAGTYSVVIYNAEKAQNTLLLVK